MNSGSAERKQLFVDEARGRLQFLREFSGILQANHPPSEDVGLLFLAAQAMLEMAEREGYPLLQELAGKMAQLFQCAMQSRIGAELAAPVMAFVSECVTVLEKDLASIERTGAEDAAEIAAFQQRFRAAFRAAADQVDAGTSKPVLFDVERLKRMMNAVGDLAMNRTRLQGRLGQLQNIAGLLNGSNERMHEELSGFQENCDFAALSRALLGIGFEISRVVQDLNSFAREVGGDIGEFTRLAHVLQDEITQKCPLPPIISRALIVKCGEHRFALPLNCVEEVQRIRPEEIEESGGKAAIKIGELVFDVLPLSEPLQLSPLQPVNGGLYLVLVKVGGRQAGILVEEVVRTDEIVINRLGEYLRNVKLFPGATVAPDGSLVLLLDLERLLRRASANAPSETQFGTEVDENAIALLSGIFAPVEQPRAAAAASNVTTDGKARRSMASIAATVAAAMQPAVVAPPVSIPGAQITGAVEIPVPAAASVGISTLPPDVSDAAAMRLEILRLQKQIQTLEAELAAEREER